MHVDKPETTVLMKASYGYMAKAAIVATARAYQKLQENTIREVSVVKKL